MNENSSDSIPQFASEWWSAGLTKIFVAVVTAGVLGLGGWMLSMHTQLITLNVKLDQLASGIHEAKVSSLEALALARDNSRRIDKIENTSFSETDANKLLLPLEHRVTRLESTKR